MASNRLVKNVTDDYLTCTICLQRYRDPRALPCEHTFCLACLANHIASTRKNNAMVCPIDKGVIALPDTSDPWECAREFSPDVLVQSLLRAVEESRNHRVTNDNRDPLDFYCFGCKMMTSAEDAIAFHRNEKCDCVKVQKAYDRIMPNVNECSRELEKLLVKSKQLKEIRSRSRGISESQTDVLSEIDSFESRLDDMYLEWKQHIHKLKAEVLNIPPDTKDSDEADDVFEKVSETYNDFNGAVDNEDAFEVLDKMKNMDDKIAELKKAVDAVPKRRSRRCSFDFIPDPHLVDFLHSRPNFGTLHSTTCTSFHARESDDSEDYNFYDVAVTKNYIVMADGERGTLERFLHRGSFVDSIFLSNSCRIASLGDDEIIVTRYFKKKMTIVSLGRKMHVKENIKTKRSYVGICVLSNGSLCASFYDGTDPSGLDIITKEGKIVKTVFGNNGNQASCPLFTVPMFITSANVGRIVVCDYSNTNHVLCYSENLELLWHQSMSQMPCGVTYDGMSTVYVSIPSENQVIALHAESGEKIRNVVKRSDGIERPYAVKYYAKKMVVTEDETDKVHILNM